MCSKEWVIRQYDHEVQGGSVIKPLVGAANDGPGDAAVLRPVLDSRRGIVDLLRHESPLRRFRHLLDGRRAIDEAVRNCVAVGADPARIAILDNFCWGTTDRPETLGSLVRAALACHDVAIALGTPFISGKDSLNNEFRPQGADEPISIPPSLLISALGQIDDVGRCVTMDLKEPGNLLYHGRRDEGRTGRLALRPGRRTLGRRSAQGRRPAGQSDVRRVAPAIDAGLVRACHDLSEGGLAVAAAEMAFAGGLGAKISLHKPRPPVARRRTSPTPPSCSANRTLGSFAKSAQRTPPRSSRPWEQFPTLKSAK